MKDGSNNSTIAVILGYSEYLEEQKSKQNYQMIRNLFTPFLALVLLSARYARSLSKSHDILPNSIASFATLWSNTGCLSAFVDFLIYLDLFRSYLDKISSIPLRFER